MHCIVLRRRNRHVVLRVVALHARDIRYAHAAGEEGIFAVGFLSTAPARVTEDVQVRRPEIQASADPYVSGFRVLHILDAPLNANLGRHGVNSRRVEGRSQTDGLWILRYTLVDHAVQRLAPPLVGGNIEPRNCCRIVIHLRGLLGQGHAMHQVSGALLR